MKVYTKRGDDGTTSLCSNVRVRKDDPRIEAYGALDELNVRLGMLLALDPDGGETEVILQTQRLLLEGAAVLTRPYDGKKEETEKLLSAFVDTLEQRIDDMTTKLPEQHTFLLPGGNVPAAEAHVARVTCRTAERRLVAATDEHFGSAALSKMLNRLSDYLYVLARRYCADGGKEEQYTL